MKTSSYLFIIFLLFNKCFAQSVTIDPKAATNGASIIKANATDAGMLIPRMSTAQRLTITGTQGLMVYDTNSNTFWYHNGSSWNQIISTTLSNQWTSVGPNLYYNNSPTGISNTNFSNVTNLAIPDNNLTGITSSITVPLNLTISNANLITIAITLNHTFMSDLVITLIAPNGTNYILLNRFGSGQNLVIDNIIRFNVSASGSIINSVNTNLDILDGTYLPTSQVGLPVGNLSSFAGMAFNGNWALKIQDLSGGDAGSLVSWSIIYGNESLPEEGKLGVGTNNPISRLDVQGGISTKYSGTVVLTTTFGGFQTINLTIPTVPFDWNFTNTVVLVSCADGNYGVIEQSKLNSLTNIRLLIDVKSAGPTRFKLYNFQVIT